MQKENISEEAEKVLQADKRLLSILRGKRLTVEEISQEVQKDSLLQKTLQYRIEINQNQGYIVEEDGEYRTTHSGIERWNQL